MNPCPSWTTGVLQNRQKVHRRPHPCSLLTLYTHVPTNAHSHPCFFLAPHPSSLLTTPIFPPHTTPMFLSYTTPPHPFSLLTTPIFLLHTTPIFPPQSHYTICLCVCMSVHVGLYVSTHKIHKCLLCCT